MIMNLLKELNVTKIILGVVLGFFAFKYSDTLLPMANNLKDKACDMDTEINLEPKLGDNL